MPTRTLFGGLIILVLALGGSTANVSAGVVYDLAADWSDTTNPNGVWSYNSSPGVPFTSQIEDYDSDSLNWFDTTQPAWAAAPPQEIGHVPFWMRIVSTNTQGWDLPIGSVVMHGAEADNPPVWAGVTWTSPILGSVVISGGVWMSNEDLGRTMEWQILKDSQLLTNATITKSDGYSSSSLMDFAQGSGGASALTLPVSPGSVITVQADKPFGMAHDLGVSLTINATAIPEPTTVVLLMVGALGVAAMTRQSV